MFYRLPDIQDHSFRAGEGQFVHAGLAQPGTSAGETCHVADQACWHARIGVVETDYESLGVDTPEDLETVSAMIAAANLEKASTN